MRQRDLDPNNVNVKDAVFGKEVEDFLHSPIGDFLIQHAEREGESALAMLKKIDAAKTEEIRKLQNIVQRAENFVVWLGDAVTAGHQAIRVLDGEEEEDHG